MDKQQKFKQIFGNSNISDIIYFHKDNINNGEYRRNLYINNFNEDKSYSFDNFKILKNKVDGFNRLKAIFISIYDYLMDFKDTNDFKFRLLTIINNWNEPIDKKYKKYKFADLWIDFGRHLIYNILSKKDSELYFKNFYYRYKNDMNIYKYFIRDYLCIYNPIRNKKLGLSKFGEFISYLKKN